MNRDKTSALQMPYLRAIQDIPGDTASEKLCWIGRLASHDQRVIRDLAQLHPKLLPVLQVVNAVKYKRHEDITSALKCADSTIVNRALKAIWYFDGGHEIVDAAYFSGSVFPHVSAHTRKRIVKTLARRARNPVFAEEIFEALASAYDFDTALPLIVVCSESFAYDTIVQRKVLLPVRILKRIFRKNLDLGVNLLRSFIYDCSKYASIRKSIGENDNSDVIDMYQSFLPKVAMKRPLIFVEIIETIGYSPDIKVLSNMCAKRLLKEAQCHIVKNPYLYISILPLKMINARRMKILFPALMKNYCCDNFRVDTMLRYLKYYPEDQKLELLLSTYRDVYGSELLKEMKNLTPQLLKLLPAQQRIELVRRNINFSAYNVALLSSDNYANNMSCFVSRYPLAYKTVWICYLPTAEAIPILKCKLSQTKDWQHKVGYILQMIYTCEINKDDDALFSTLTDVKNEIVECMTLKLIVDNFLSIFRIPHLNERIYSLVYYITRSIYMRYGYLNKSLLVKLAHYRIIHNMQVKNLIDMLIVANHDPSRIEFNILKDYPHCERQCLVTFIDRIQAIFFTRTIFQEEQDEEQENEDEEAAEEQEDEEIDIEQENEEIEKIKNMREEEEEQDQLERREKAALCRLVAAIYDFNDRCKRSGSTVERITIKDYPSFMAIIRTIVCSDEDFIFQNEAQDTLRRQEPELYRDWFLLNTSKKIADVTSDAALRLLQRDSQSILDNWQEYLIDCQMNYQRKHVQRFVRATRWYKDISIKFAEHCVARLHEKDADEVSSALIILSILLHGDTLTELIISLTSAGSALDVDCPSAANNFRFKLDFCMKLSNPPMALERVAKLSERNYLSMTLMTLTRVSRRSSLPKIRSFLPHLLTMVVNIRKYWIELMYTIAPTSDLIAFLDAMWSLEMHHLVRQRLLDTVQRLLCERPQPNTWLLCRKIILTLPLKDEELLWKMKYRNVIPDKYAGEYFTLWFDKIEALAVMGLRSNRTRQHTETGLTLLNWYLRDTLPVDYIENVIRRMLFHDDAGISEATRHFVISYLLTYPTCDIVKGFAVVCGALHNALICRWNRLHPKNPRFYPVKNAVHLFLDQFITGYMRRLKDIDPRMIHNIQMIFSSVLSPQSDAKSYLLLMYSSILYRCTSTLFLNTCFGLALGEIMPLLISTFTQYLIPLMARTLERFLKLIYGPDNCMTAIYNTIEGLMNVDNTFSRFMAMTMLSWQERGTVYYRLIDKAMNSFSYTSDAILLYHCINTTDFHDAD